MIGLISIVIALLSLSALAAFYLIGTGTDWTWLDGPCKKAAYFTRFPGSCVSKGLKKLDFAPLYQQELDLTKGTAR